MLGEHPRASWAGGTIPALIIWSLEEERAKFTSAGGGVTCPAAGHRVGAGLGATQSHLAGDRSPTRSFDSPG